MELLGDVRLDRVEAQRGRGDAGEPQDIVGDDGVGRPEDRVAERNIDAERISVRFPCEPTLGAEAQALVLHALVLDLGMLRIRADLEGEEVAEVEASRGLEPGEHVVGRPGEAEVDVLRGSRALETQLEHEPTFEHRRVAEHGDNPREEAVEHEQLAVARKLRARLRRRAKPLLEGLLERFRGRVRSRGHPGSPPNAFSEALTSGSSPRTTRPRRRACFAAFCSSSGDRPSRAQSLSVLLTEVMGTGPNQVRSSFGTSA